MPRAACAAILGLVLVAPGPSFGAYPRPLRAAHGAVAADHLVASQAGARALERGGNAVDAACVTALTLGVANPTSSGIGGGGFLLLFLAQEKKTVALDFRERAPAAATREMYVENGKVRPERSGQGPLAVAVPGEVAGLHEAVEKYGRLGWKACVEPAARLAHAGPAASAFLARAAGRVVPRLGPGAPLLALVAPGGKPLEEGQKVDRAALARTLDVLAADPDAFYRGALAREIARAVKEAGGILGAEDLAGYRTTWRTPLGGTYRGHRVAAMPPPSSGGTALLETLNILERHDLAKTGFGSSAHLHLLAEALKHAFADRSRFLGDPDFVKVPAAHLVSKDYAGSLDRRVHPDRVLRTGEYGTPVKQAALLRDAGTSHISVLDADGNAAALTTTVNGYFGSGLVAGSTGIVLNNEMDDFSPLPGVPNESGLITGEGNAIAPGKRPLSSMTPTIVFEGERPWIVVGGSGSPRIITGTLQALLAVVDFGLDAQAAVSAPRIHTQWVPEALRLEAFIPADVAQALARRGHKVEPESDFCAIQIVVAQKGHLEAASDPRKGGAPAGY